MTEPPSTTAGRGRSSGRSSGRHRGSSRRREAWATVAVVALAGVCGLVAAHFGTHRAWENPTTSTSTSTSVPFVDPQRIP